MGSIGMALTARVKKRTFEVVAATSDPVRALAKSAAGCAYDHDWRRMKRARYSG
jgi:hypothetical protein